MTTSHLLTDTKQRTYVNLQKKRSMNFFLNVYRLPRPLTINPGNSRRDAVHQTDSQSDGSRGRDPAAEVSCGRVPHRGDPLGARRQGIARRSKAEGAGRRHPRHQSGGEEGGLRRVHLLGEEQAGAQRQAERRS